MQKDSNPIVVDEPLFSSEVQKMILISLVALSLIGGGWFFWSTYLNHLESKMHEALILAKTPEEKKKVADAHPGTHQAFLFYLELAHESLKTNSQEALDLYETALKKNPQHPLANAALMGKAQALEKLNKAPEALAIYQSLAQKTDGLYGPQALLQVVRLQSSQGQNAQARQNLLDLMTRYPDYTNEAKERLKRIPE